MARIRIPQFPNTCYGNVTINGGQPAPVGMVVTAVVNRGETGSEKRYSLAITEPGNYGAANGRKLKVGGDQQGEIADGSNIQFFLSIGALPDVINNIEPVAEVSFFDDRNPHNVRMDLDTSHSFASDVAGTNEAELVVNDGTGDNAAGTVSMVATEGETAFDRVVELPNPGQFAVLSAPGLLSRVPTITQDDPAGDSLIMVYANNQFLIFGEPGFDQEIVKPVTAFYITASSNATVGFNLARISAPRRTSKSLDAGWNLIGTNYPGPAQDEFSQIQNTRTNPGMVALHVPNTANGNKNLGREDWAQDGDRELNANPITALPDRNLSVLDGYWVFLDGPRSYTKLLAETP